MKPANIIRANTAVRKEPERLTQLLEVLPKGERVLIINAAPITNGYVNIQLKNKVTGWVMKECLSEFSSNGLSQVHKKDTTSEATSEVVHDSENE